MQSDGTDNVLDLETYRARRPHSSHSIVYYLHESARWEESLKGVPSLWIEEIGSLGDLKAQLLSRAPDLILIESKITWTSPVDTIHLLSSLVEAPIVMIAEPSEDPSLIKQAYAAGAHDTLYTPIKREELREVFDVLLKLRKVD